MLKATGGRLGRSRLALGRVVIYATAIALVPTALTIAQSQPAQAEAVAVPETIAADCSVDVTGQLLTWIGSVPNGSTLSFQPAGCYRIDGTLLIKDRAGLTFRGNGATFKAVTSGTELGSKGARTRSHWSVRNGINMVLQDMIIRGAHPNAGTGDAAYVPSLEAQHGIELIATRGGLIDNVQIYDVYGDFVYFGMGGANRILTSGITVRNSHFDRNGRTALAFTGAEDILVENNYIDEVRRTMFDLEPNFSDGHIRRITIKNNQLGNHRLHFLSSVGTGTTSSTIEDITVKNNILTGGALDVIVNPPLQIRRRRFKIVDNATETPYGNSGAAAMIFARTDGVEVSGNAQKLQIGRGMAGVELYGSTGARVFNNSFVNADTAMRAEGDAAGTPSSDYHACNNKIAEQGEFNDPSVCVAPAVTITNPAPGSGLHDTVAIAATATGVLDIAAVELYIDDQLFQAFDEAPYAVAWDTHSVPNNTAHNIRVRAINAAGVEASAEITVLVNNDMNQPTVAITDPRDNGHVRAIVSVTAAATDDSGVVSDVRFYLDGALLGTVGEAPYQYLLDTTAYVDGVHALEVRATDPSGNEGVSAVSVLLDNTAPSGPTVLQSTTLGEELVGLAWQASSDANAPLKYQVLRNGTLLAESGTNAYDDTSVQMGTAYTYVVRAVDPAGNVSSDSNAVAVTTPLVETWTGPDGSAWSSNWVLEGASDQIQTRDIYGNEARVIAKSNASGKALAYVGGIHAVDVTQATTFRMSANSASLGLIARRSDADSDTYYYASATAAGGSTAVRIKKVVDGVETFVGYTSLSIAANVDYKIRFDVLSTADPAKTSLKVKVWNAGVAEPDAFNLSKLDAEPRLQGVIGRLGLFYGLYSTRTVWTDDYSAAVTL